MTRAAMFLGLLSCCTALAWPARASEVPTGGEVFIDSLDISGGFMSPLSALSPRPQTQLHVIPMEFLSLDADLPFVRHETFLQYQIRIGGSIAFFKRFELGLELVPLHVAHARVEETFTGSEYSDSDANFGQFAFHFLGNIVAVHGQFPQYFSGAFRLTFPTAGDINLNLDDNGGPEFQAESDSWIMEPQLIYGITLGNMVTLSTRQGLAIVVVDESNDWPFAEDDQVHWAMNFAAGVAPLKWFSLLADFTAMFCMNEVEYQGIEHSWGTAPGHHGHPKFVYVGFGGKFYPVPEATIEAGFRFALTDEARETVGAFSFSLEVSYEFGFSVGGVTIIKEGAGGGATASGAGTSTEDGKGGK